MPEYHVAREINLEAERVQREQTSGKTSREVFGVQSFEDGNSFRIDLKETQ